MKNERSEQYYINTFGEEVGKEKYKKLIKDREKRKTQQTTILDEGDPSSFVVCMECNKKFKRITRTHLKNGCTSIMSVEEYLQKYPTANIICDKVKETLGFTKESSILKYGEELGNKKWNEYCEKQALTNTFQYKAERYNMTLDEFNSYNKSRAVTLENLIKKHGEIIGLSKWESYCERQRYTTTIEYFIEKYGDDGRDKWEEFCASRGNAGSIEFIQIKYNVSEEEAEIILSKRYTSSGCFSSINEKEFIDVLLNNIPDIKYTYKTRQFCIWNRYINAPMYYDATCSKKKKIIEYNGDYWHTNPDMYNEDFYVKQLNMTAKEIRIRDSHKIQAAFDRGFDVYTVWESDFMSNKDIVIEKIKQWWNNDIS